MVAVGPSRNVIPGLGLDAAELRKRAQALKLVLTDCDGVMTDAGVYYSHQGEEFRRFSVRDGMGVQRLREAGIETAIISRENSIAIRKRSEKLLMSHVYLGVLNKSAHLAEIRHQYGVAEGQLAYMGDDLNDLEIIETIGRDGLTAAPADAMDAVLASVHYRAPAKGGFGAFRDFAEWIIGLREIDDLRGPADAGESETA